MGEMIQIKALKYPDILHYEWQAELLEQTSDFVAVLTKPGTKFIHHTKKFSVYKTSTWFEFFPLKEWYTLSIQIENEKIVSNYCNISLPSKMNHNELTFIDLDIDLVKERGRHEWKVVDEEEFKTNCMKYHYTQEMITGAKTQQKTLLDKIHREQFPFNDGILKLLPSQL